MQKTPIQIKSHQVFWKQLFSSIFADSKNTCSQVIRHDFIKISFASAFEEQIKKWIEV